MSTRPNQYSRGLRKGPSDGPADQFAELLARAAMILRNGEYLSENLLGEKIGEALKAHGYDEDSLVFGSDVDP